LLALYYLIVVVIRMRPTIILLLAILLSCLSVIAHAFDPGDIAAPSANVPNMDMPKPVPRPNMDMPEPKQRPLAEPSNNPTQAINQTGNISSDQIQGTGIQQEIVPMDVSGKWSIKFDDAPDRSLDLNLWSPTGTTKIMGFGTLMEKGTGNSVTAVGSVTAQELRVTVKSATSEYINQKYDECDLDLFLVNNTLSGMYFLKSGGQLFAEGNATAVKQ
jgi:hypothetical protein